MVKKRRRYPWKPGLDIHVNQTFQILCGCLSISELEVLAYLRVFLFWWMLQLIRVSGAPLCVESILPYFTLIIAVGVLLGVVSNSTTFRYELSFFLFCCRHNFDYLLQAMELVSNFFVSVWVFFLIMERKLLPTDERLLNNQRVLKIEWRRPVLLHNTHSQRFGFT